MGGADLDDRSLLRKGWSRTCCASCRRRVSLWKRFREVETAVGVRKPVKVEEKISNSSQILWEQLINITE